MRAWTPLFALLIACGGSNHHGTDANGGDDDAPIADATSNDAAQSFGLTAIFPPAASRTVTTDLTITGYGITGAPTIHITNCDQATVGYDLVTGATTSTSIATSLAADPTRVQGLYTVSVTNGDGMTAKLMCALRIVAEPPPTVTVVVPTTAWRGDPNDMINSDVTVHLRGTGFLSTPNVRWVSTTNAATFFDAPFVGFVSSTELSAVVPSESQSMPAGTYNVFVTNPDQLTAEWKDGTTPGLFTITTAPPPDLVDVSPARIQNGICGQPLTLTGTNFQTGATAWYVAPAGTACTGSTTDANGLLLCPIAVDSVQPTTITAHLAVCPALGPYPVVVVNPDHQSDYWYSIEITPSSDGHLNTGPFETVANRLETPRWKHAVQFGFDAFSHAFVYVAGGQDTAGNVLGSVEASEFDLFGTPGPFHHVEQYGSPTMPRVPNNLTVPREGATLVRVGKSLWAIGGTTVRSDVATPVAGSKAVERAQILSYNEMPGVMRPIVQATTGLPIGSWYYRVSAIGPWGESLATREVVAINTAGTLRVCWVAPVAPGVVSYNIYRSLASDGRASTSAAIAYEQTGTCFDDTGAGTLTPGPGNARGTVAAGGSNAAGTYTYRVSAVVPLAGGGTYETYASYATATTIAPADVTAGNRTVQVAWDPPTSAAGVTYRVYRLDTSTSTFKLLAGAGALTATTFSDDGTVAFDASAATPRSEILPLPTGSLSKWDPTGPQLMTAREGLDGVVVTMDPATSNNLVARIIVAGGRTGAGGAYTYHTTAESLGVNLDGTTDTAWTAETSQFTHARAYYALLTTQDRNVTPFPPGGDTPPCGSNCGTVIQSHGGAGGVLRSALTPPNVTGTEPVYIVAVMGDDAFAASSNQGRSDFESCAVDMTTGHLACGTTWTVQAQTDPHATFGADAVLYFAYMYPFYAIASETLGGATTSIQFLLSAIGRFPLLDLTAVVGGQIFANRQSASTTFVVARAYYQMTRLLAFVYVVGGWAEAHLENGVTVPAGPTGLVERHQQ